MTITYPLSLPTARKASRISIRPNNIVGVNKSPFTGSRQTIVYPGQWWAADVSLPPMKDADAQEWIAFLLKLNGKMGTFLMGDPAKATPSGSAASTPGSPQVDGAGQTGHYLNIKGMPNSATNYLKTGDYIQLGTTTDTRLYKLLEPLSSDGSGKGTATVWPRVRVAPSDSQPITVSNCVGLFSLAENNSGWDEEPGTIYTVSFSAEEVI